MSREACYSLYLEVPPKAHVVKGFSEVIESKVCGAGIKGVWFLNQFTD